MNKEEILKSYMRRRYNGQLAYPRTVHAHLEEIKQFAPDFLTEEDYNYISKFNSYYEQKKAKAHSIRRQRGNAH